MDDQQQTGDIAAQIKERVRQADQARIAKRAEAAAEVASKLHERDQIRAQLQTVENDLDRLVASATTDLLSTKELAEFIGVKPADLTTKPRRAPRAKRAARPPQ